MRFGGLNLKQKIQVTLPRQRIGMRSRDRIRFGARVDTCSSPTQCFNHFFRSGFAERANDLARICFSTCALYVPRSSQTIGAYVASPQAHGILAGYEGRFRFVDAQLRSMPSISYRRPVGADAKQCFKNRQFQAPALVRRYH